jgi:hypothetical protein
MLLTLEIHFLKAKTIISFIHNGETYYATYLRMKADTGLSKG